MKQRALMTHENDSVATALTDLSAGDDVSFERGCALETLRVADDISFGHKFALTDIPEGSCVVKYGEVIGRATAFIGKGRHVHVHNLESLRGRGDLAAKKRDGKEGEEP